VAAVDMIQVDMAARTISVAAIGTGRYWISLIKLAYTTQTALRLYVTYMVCQHGSWMAETAQTCRYVDQEQSCSPLSLTLQATPHLDGHPYPPPRPQPPRLWATPEASHPQPLPLAVNLPVQGGGGGRGGAQGESV
jgi:hypothetical protein